MKKLFKNVLAMTVAAALAAGCITASAAPSIKVANNENAPATYSATANVQTVKVTATDFASVAGQDVTVTVADGLTLQGVTAEGITLTEGENYVINGNTVKFVDVLNLADAQAVTNYVVNLAVVVPNAIASYDIGITAQLVDEDEQEVGSVTAGKLVVGIKSGTKAVTKDQVFTLDDDVSFVPGVNGAYYGTTTLRKQADNSFVAPANANISYRSFKLPAAGKTVTTYGFTRNNPTGNEERAIMFGSHVINYSANSDTTYGTLLILGDFEGLKAALSSNPNFDTAEKVIQTLSNWYDARFAPGEDAGFSTAGYTLYLKKAPQAKFVWLGNDSMDYTIRVTGVEGEDRYTAVGYAINGTTTTFSTEIKSGKFNK